MKYAIIKTGGKQYKIKVGDTLKVEKLSAEPNSEIEFKEVLLVFDDAAKEIKIGTPYIENAFVKARVMEQGRGKKITVVKYKPKIRYKKVYGARQPYTKIEILKINE